MSFGLCDPAGPPRRGPALKTESLAARPGAAQPGLRSVSHARGCAAMGDGRGGWIGVRGQVSIRLGDLQQGTLTVLPPREEQELPTRAAWANRAA